MHSFFLGIHPFSTIDRISLPVKTCRASPELAAKRGGMQNGYTLAGRLTFRCFYFRFFWHNGAISHFNRYLGFARKPAPVLCCSPIFTPLSDPGNCHGHRTAPVFTMSLILSGYSSLWIPSQLTLWGFALFRWIHCTGYFNGLWRLNTLHNQIIYSRFAHQCFRISGLYHRTESASHFSVFMNLKKICIWGLTIYHLMIY